MMLLFLFCTLALAGEIDTNSVAMLETPSWVKASRVERVTDKVQRSLEWDIRKVRARWYNDQKAFQQAHGFDASVLAVSKREENLILIGPKVTTDNFDGVFGHELAHIIMFQKYKNAIPKWLEEGLANYAAKRGVIDYAWLNSQPAIDVRTMSHPFGARASNGPKYHYMASSALMEMIAAKCPIHDLLQLSVGQSLDSYLGTFCQIPDLNEAFKRWLDKKAKSVKNS